MATLTMLLYQRGLERADAIAKGANAVEFDHLEGEYKGGSIPLHVLRGFKAPPSYSCDYHTGGAQGRLLRAVIKGVNHA